MIQTNFVIGVLKKEYPDKTFKVGMYSVATYIDNLLCLSDILNTSSM